MFNKTYGTHEWAVASIRLNLLIMGLWKKPKNQTDKICNALPILILNTFLIVCNIIPQLWALSKIWRHFHLIIGHIMVVVTFSFSVFKMLFLLSKSTAIHNFFLRIEDDWSSPVSEYERFIMIKYWKLVQRIHLIAFLFGVFLAVTFHCTVLFNFVLRFPSNLTDTIPGRYLAYYSVYPYDTQPSPNYELTACNEFIGGMAICIALVVADVLYGALVFHTCGQLEILAHRIKSIVENPHGDVVKLMSIYVEHHLRIIRFAKDIDNLFNGILLLVFLHFTLGFCSQAFTAMLLSSQHLEAKQWFMQISFFLVYTCYLLYFTFIYCWAGEKLMFKSENICFAVYNCNWMNLPPSKSLLLRLIVIRSQRPLAVTAGKFLPITLNTYAKLIKTCCGYISMLHALNR